MLKILMVLLTTVAVRAEGINLESVSATEQGENFSASLVFGSQVTGLNPKVEYINETIQLDIPNASVKDGKILKKVAGDRIKSLLAYQLNKDTLRFRIILNKGIKAAKFKNQVTTEFTGNGLLINVGTVATQNTDDEASSAIVNAKPRELNTEAPVKTAEIDEEKIEAELASLATAKTAVTKETPKKEAKTNEASTATSANTAATQDEASIPVLNNTTDKKVKTASNSGLKLTLSLAIVALCLFGVWWASQKWLGKKSLKNPHTNIRVLTQHYLGPKKSLAIVSVAGESILIGVTDQNINLIKTLSLLDEEIPQDVPVSFNKALQAADASAEDNIEDFAMKGVKEVVSEKLKGMRNLW